MVLEAAGLAEPASSAADLDFADFDFVVFVGAVSSASALVFAVFDFVVLDDADLAFEPSVDSDLAAVSFAFVVLGA